MKMNGNRLHFISCSAFFTAEDPLPYLSSCCPFKSVVDVNTCVIYVMFESCVYDQFICSAPYLMVLVRKT